jgi:two-component sensor histidine kinase
MVATPSESRRELLCLFSAFAACLALGAADAFIPREAAVGVLYAPIVLLAMSSRRRWAVLTIAALGCSLTWLDYFISTDGGSAAWDIFDRAVATVAIGTSALLCLSRISDERAIRRALRVESLLRTELDERVRRNLAFLRAMLALEAGDASIGRDQLVHSLRTRIRSMVEFHDLLSSNRWQPLSLHDLVAAVSPPTRGAASSAVHASGPQTLIPPGQVGGLGAVLHELVLHSARHGALSTSSGQLDIRWDVRYDALSSSRRLELVWHESDAPGIRHYPSHAAPELLEPFVREILGGDIEFAYPATGAFHRITLVLHDEPDLYSSTPPPAPRTKAPAPGRPPATASPHPHGPDTMPGLALVVG